MKYVKLSKSYYSFNIYFFPKAGLNEFKNKLIEFLKIKNLVHKPFKPLKIKALRTLILFKDLRFRSRNKT